MKKYCLNLMGVDNYSRKKNTNSEVFQDIKLFAEKLKIPLMIQNNGIVVGCHRMSAQQLAGASGKKQLFDWIMEKYSA